MNQTEEDLETVESIKQKGNECLKQGNYVESVFHYTRAIKKDPTNYSLYSNRSYAFLKGELYYFAMNDAQETIRLNPTWAKGYFRKAEVDYATYRFPEALLSYKEALNLKPDDIDIVNAITRTHRDWEKENRADVQIPWLGAGIGLVFGVVIVIADYLCTATPTLSHPILMAVLTIAISLLGYGLSWAIRFYIKCQRNSLYETPEHIENSNSNDEETNEVNTENRQERTRYTKTQARYRYKKGKL